MTPSAPVRLSPPRRSHRVPTHYGGELHAVVAGDGPATRPLIAATVSCGWALATAGLKTPCVSMTSSWSRRRSSRSGCA